MNNSLAVCVDASIVLRRILQPDDESVKKPWGVWTSQQYRLVAPALLFYEVTNGLYQHQKLGLLSPETIRDSLEIAVSMPIQLVGEVGLHQRACEIAAQYKLPATYDAHYLALAERMDIDLWTADARLVGTLKPFKLGWVKGI
ncbi:MAG: type II toxin-antitoxin system VapC family toxin [Chloroflexota bacterium]